MRLIIATQNKNKFREIKKIFKGLSIKLVYLGQLNKAISIEEDGKSFFENALKKAQACSLVYKDDLVVGEDSGLQVPYLGNRPGVLSKRYAGKKPTDLNNNLRILKELEGLKKKDRKANFRCVIALVKNGKLIKKFEATLVGIINDRILGKNGFGYDPVFYLPQYKKTVAQFSLAEKNKISHRAKVFLKLKKFLASYLKNK